MVNLNQKIDWVWQIFYDRFHSLHHTQFKTNYSLFMPLYDYIYGTMDKSCDELYETTLKRKEESPQVVHLTHLTTPESIYHLRLGFASLASEPHTSKWYIGLMWPVTLWSMMLTWVHGRTFIVERNRFNKLTLQTWAIPKYTVQVNHHQFCPFFKKIFFFHFWKCMIDVYFSAWIFYYLLLALEILVKACELTHIRIYFLWVKCWKKRFI